MALIGAWWLAKPVFRRVKAYELNTQTAYSCAVAVTYLPV